LHTAFLDVGQELVDGIIRAAALGTGHGRGPVQLVEVGQAGFVEGGGVNLGRWGRQRAGGVGLRGLAADPLDVFRVGDGYGL
jgi:hypothetical protein